MPSMEHICARGYDDSYYYYNWTDKLPVKMQLLLDVVVHIRIPPWIPALKNWCRKIASSSRTTRTTEQGPCQKQQKMPPPRSTLWTESLLVDFSLSLKYMSCSSLRINCWTSIALHMQKWIRKPWDEWPCPLSQKQAVSPVNRKRTQIFHVWKRRLKKGQKLWVSVGHSYVRC